MSDDLPPGFVVRQPGAPSPVAPVAAAPANDLPAGFKVREAPVDEGPWQRGTVLPVEKNTTTGKVRLAYPQVVRDAIDAFNVPGDVATGQLDLNTPEGMDRLVGLAGLATTGVAPRQSARVLTEAGKVVPKPVARAIRSDGMTPEQVAQKLQDLGPDAVLADAGPNLQSQAAAVATVPGAGQKTVVDTMTARKAGAPDRLRNELDTTLGPAPVPAQVHTGLKGQMKELSPEYETVLQKAQPVDTTALADSLDKAIPTLRGDAQTAVKNVRKMLDKTGGETVNDPATIISAETDPAKRRELVRKHLAGEPLVTPAPLDSDPRTLFETRKAIDGLLDSTTDSNVRRVLVNARKDVDGILGASASGIKEVDAKYQTLAKQGESFDRGQTVLGNGRDTPRPAELRSEVNQVIAGGGDPKALQQLTQGARAEIDRIVGTNLNDRAALNGLLKGEGDWNYDRLTTLFGKEKTDRIYKVLENERTMAETENRALSGSKTAAVTAAQAEVSSPTKGPGVVQAAGDLHFGTAAKRAGEAVLGGIADRRKAASNSNIADVIMGNGPLKSDIYGQPVPLTPLIEAIMRSDQSGRSPAQGADRERLKRSVNNKVY